MLLLDSSQPRNSASQGMHGFLSRDGILPAEFRETSRYVAGDTSAQAQQAVLAAASGAMAAIHLNEEMVTEAFNNLY